MALVHYKGEVGEFDYDGNIFYVDCEGLLRFKGDYEGPIDLPKG